MSEPKRVEAPPRLTPDGETDFNVLMALTKAYCGCATATPMDFSQRERRRSLSTASSSFGPPGFLNPMRIRTPLLQAHPSLGADDQVIQQLDADEPPRRRRLN